MLTPELIRHIEIDSGMKFTLNPVCMKSFILYIWLFAFSFFSSKSYGQAEPFDSLVLIDFFNSLNDAARSNLNWNEDNFGNPVRLWDGVSLDSEGSVIGLYLNNKQIEGPFPNEINNLGSFFELVCSNNQITSLPDSLPFQLDILDCGNNQLKALPELPSTLHELYCDSNQLTRLPDLPAGDLLAPIGPANFSDGLHILNCRSNQILALPDLPFSLEFLDAGDNRLRRLPTLPTDFLDTLYVDRNRLRDLPSLAGLSLLDTLNCSWNSLTFEDIELIFQAETVEKVNYAPQNGLGYYEYYYYPGLDVNLTIYPDTMPLLTNEYEWAMNGSLILMGDTDTLFLPGITYQDSGLYQLQVINETYPELMLEGAIRLRIMPEDSIPISTTGIIIQHFEDATDDDRNQIQMTMESLGMELLRECWCAENGDALLQLYGGLAPGFTILDPNTVKPGSKSLLDVDTTEFDFLLIHNPFEGPTSNLNCTDTIENALNADYNALVALIDSGVDTLHPDLNTWLWANPDTEMDGTCFADDYRGWDFPNGRPEIVDLASHGTHSMGIIRFRYPEDVSLEVMNLKVFEDSTGVLFDLICAIHYAVTIGVDVINVSLGYYAPTPSGMLYDALKRAQDAGIIVVVSAGNEGADVSNLPGGNNRWPGNFKFRANEDTTMASLDNLIVVGALNAARNDTASYSNFGPYVDLLAPGTGIRSTLPGGLYGNLSGTSMSTSFVTRLISVIKAKAPDTPYQEIIRCIRESTAPVLSSNIVGWNGKLDYEAALACLRLEGAIAPPENTRPGSIHIYPNPFTEVVNIILEDGNSVFENVTLTVTTMYGGIVYTETCNASALQWNGCYSNGNKAPRGIYFLHVRVGGSRSYIVPVLRL